MSFFDELPGPELRVDVDRSRPPEWTAPPENVVGITVPVDLIVARTPDVAVVLGGMTAYPTGVLFGVEILRRSFENEEDDPFSMRFQRPRKGGFRLGVQLPDGLRLVAGGGMQPERARLSPQGGGGGGLSYEIDYWLWPLPGEGTLRFACEWTEQGIGATIQQVDTAPIRAAAARAVELWPDERPVDEDDEW